MILYLILFAHFMCDWIFQTRGEAYLKVTDWKCRASHCLDYTMWFFIVLNIAELPIVWWIYPYLFVTHFLFDTPEVKKWWVKHAQFGNPSEEPVWFWVGLDQALHFVSFIPLILVYRYY